MLHHDTSQHAHSPTCLSVGAAGVSNHACVLATVLYAVFSFLTRENRKHHTSKTAIRPFLLADDGRLERSTPLAYTPPVAYCMYVQGGARVRGFLPPLWLVVKTSVTSVRPQSGLSQVVFKQACVFMFFDFAFFVLSLIHI